jgi:hypothetical protein
MSPAKKDNLHLPHFRASRCFIGLPSFNPRAFAAATPALMRSTMSSRSNWATAAWMFTCHYRITTSTSGRRDVTSPGVQL